MRVMLSISGYPDKTSAEDAQKYLQCVKFMAYWFEMQDGANGKSTQELFDEFRGHVTQTMLGAVAGEG